MVTNLFFKKTNENARKGLLFSMFKKIGFCVGPEMFLLHANGIAGFGSLNLFSLVILSVFLAWGVLEGILEGIFFGQIGDCLKSELGCEIGLN